MPPTHEAAHSIVGQDGDHADNLPYLLVGDKRTAETSAKTDGGGGTGESNHCHKEPRHWKLQSCV